MRIILIPLAPLALAGVLCALTAAPLAAEPPVDPAQVRINDNTNFPTCQKFDEDSIAAAECREEVRNKARERAERERVRTLEAECKLTDHYRLPISCHRLGVMYERAGDMERAKRFYRASCEDTFDKKHSSRSGCRAMGRFYWTPFNIGLFDPAQLFSRNRALNGLGIGVFSSNHIWVRGAQVSTVNISQELYGLQLGLFSNRTRRGRGLQIAWLMNYAHRNFYGLQLSWLLNFSVEKFYGLQLGPINLAATQHGVQIGLWNFGGDGFGFQMGLVNTSRTRDGAMFGVFNVGSVTRGLRIGVANLSTKDGKYPGTMTGLTIGAFNYDYDAMRGVGIGAVNFARDVRGIQIGAVNGSKTMTGLQIGVINYTERASGVQIGVINIIRKGPVPVMLLFNADFDDLSPAEYRARELRAY